MAENEFGEWNLLDASNRLPATPPSEPLNAEELLRLCRQAVCSCLDQHRLSKELAEAIRANDVAAVRYWLHEGADPNVFANLIHKTPALILAVTDYHDEKEYIDDDGEQAGGSYYIPRQVNTEILSALLEAGANINGWDAGGETALLYAARFMMPQVLRFLIERGASIETSFPVTMTALKWAVYHDGFHRDPEMTRLLLDLGADIDVQDRYGATPLMVAVDDYFGRNVNIRIVQVLLDRGADVKVQDAHGKTVLDRLGRPGFFDLTKRQLWRMIKRASSHAREKAR